MNTQEIKIKVPEGKRAVYDEATQTIKFVDAERVRSKSWEEFCQNHPQVSYEYYLHQSAWSAVEPTTETRLNFRHTRHGEQAKALLETQKDAEGIIALIQLKRLHDEWLGDWKPIYNEHQTSVTLEKYVIYYHREELIIDVAYHSQRFLTFPTREMATEFLSYFKDLIKTAKMFI